MYAEDWIYAPAVTKTAEILRATKDKILFMKGEESHSGSHAAHAAQWAMTGGGSLIRMGCHPLSAVLYLKQVEAKARGETIRVASVSGDVGNVTAVLKPEERTYIKANPVDVEDWGTLTATFSDGTKATVFSGDMIMGGVRNLIETYTSGGSLFANITPNNHLMSYQDLRGETRLRLHHREGRPQNRLAICLPRRGMDARLSPGDPGLHGMRRDGTAAAVGPRAGVRDDQGELRGILGGGGGTKGGDVGRDELTELAAGTVPILLPLREKVA
ncbi:putative dehydrogenase [Bradyrhizobium sp. GM22.5]